MLIQRAGAGTLPPPGFSQPPWELLAQRWNAIPSPETENVVVGPCSLTVGQNDSEADDAIFEHEVDHTYGWDNESPARTVQVGAFRSEWRTVTNKEFERYWRGKGALPELMPKSWVLEDGAVKASLLSDPFPDSLNNIPPVGQDSVRSGTHADCPALARSDILR